MGSTPTFSRRRLKKVGEQRRLKREVEETGACKEKSNESNESNESNDVEENGELEAAMV